MIIIKNLYFGYRRNKTLFDNLNINFVTGKIYGLLGKNGAGKTSLLKIICGTLYPKEGKCSFGNIETKSRLPEILKEIYLVPEEFSLPNISINEYIGINSVFYDKFDRNIMINMLDEFQIPLDEELSAFSYGQKKKFLIAFGIATNAKVVLFDEPTNGLDIPSKAQFRRISAKYLSDDRCFIISTHQVRDLENLLDVIVIIESGKMVFNYDINIISSKLAFVNDNFDFNKNDVLYWEEIFGGKHAIIKNNGQLETRIDLELLFNGVLNNPKSFDDILN